MGGTPIGAPFVGWVSNVAGPRWAVGVAAAAGASTAVVGIVWIIRARRLRLRFDSSARGMRFLRIESHGAGPAKADGAVKAFKGDGAVKRGRAARDPDPGDADQS
jgi:hypothetical protein